jgi:hypothetical protein
MAVHLFIIYGPRIQLIGGHRPNLIHVCNAQLPFRRVDRSRARRCVHKDGDDVLYHCFSFLKEDVMLGCCVQQTMIKAHTMILSKH